MEMKDLVERIENIQRLLSCMLDYQLRMSDMNIVGKVDILSRHNMSSAEIAEVLGITRSHAAKELSVLKQKKKK